MEQTNNSNDLQNVLIEIKRVIEAVLSIKVWAVPINVGLDMSNQGKQHEIATVEFQHSVMDNRFIEQEKLFEMTEFLHDLVDRLPECLKQERKYILRILKIGRSSFLPECLVDYKSGKRTWLPSSMSIENFFTSPIGLADRVDDLSFEMFKVSLKKYFTYICDRIEQQ